MPQVVYKYSLGFSTTVLELPLYAEILCVEMQGMFPVIWAQVSPEETETHTHVIVAINTGTIVDMISPHYIGTFSDDGIVWHVFDTSGVSFPK